MEFEITDEIKQFAQFSYEQHRILWLERIKEMISFKEAYSYAGLGCFGCVFSRKIDVTIKYVTGCNDSCLFELKDVKGEECFNCNSLNTCYWNFKLSRTFEEALRWAWEVYYAPMAPKWRFNK